MNKQEIFTTVKNHLLTQNKQCLDETGVCSYRANYGTKCAVGCLIPDDRYSPSIEGNHIHEESVRDAIPIFDYVDCGVEAHLNDMVNFCSDLQDIHDCSLPEEWPERLRTLASKEGLEY